MDLIGLVIFIILIAILLPVWPYSKNWGYRPAGVVGLLLLVFLFYLFFRHEVM
nr:DUF3309 family protein [Legionella nagasakiensis]